MSNISSLFHPLSNVSHLGPLFESIGSSKYVLLGEASHGTHEFYTWRAHISKHLIQEKGFTMIAVEGDWPDCFVLNKWIKNPDDKTPIAEILMQFNRWPTWMWGNWEIASFAGWLKEYNSSLPYEKRCGFYGLDVYSLWESLDIMVNYLQKEDPPTAQLAVDAFRCFEPYKEGDSYASVYAHSLPDCKKKVVKLLKEVRENSWKYDHEMEGGLNAELNSLVMKNAEKYYEALAGFGDDSWNVRDRHMVETLETLMKYHGDDNRVVIWEHNTHIGDARATNMKRDGLINVGQLLREKYQKDGVYLAGFGTWTGTVRAAKNWGAPMQIMNVPEAMAGSIEELLHSQCEGNILIVFKDNHNLEEAFSNKMGHRAIGVVYHPSHERGNYVPTRLSQRYDAFLFLERTEALHPLKIKPDGHKVPDTYPFGI
ncbi:erythromycin esterase family protein [Antarcticibacterium arcticum]|nr:erythromycin esterase family protein [Antarcticibacterium arcticum]